MSRGLGESPRRWVAIIAAVAAAFFSGCAASSPTVPPVALGRFEFERPQMGVPFRMVLHAPDRATATAAAEAAFSRVEQLNRVLSDYDPDSEVSRLCSETPAGGFAKVSEDLWRMLERSQAIARSSSGAFDVTVGPLVNLWRRARRRTELPAAHLVDEAMARSGWRKLHLDARGRRVRFEVAGMRLDFGGIAKGYAADEALRVLRDRGVTRALVAAAGDIVVGDPPPGQSGWRIEVGGSGEPGAPPPRILRLRHAAVSTSGDLFQRLEIGGRRYSHIVDPATGIGLTNQTLVTVVARDGATADATSTAVSVLGPERGLRWLEGIPGAAGLCVTRDEAGYVSMESRRFGRLPRDAAPNPGTP